MNQVPFVSVVIPSWRDEKTLFTCLTSLLKQNYNPKRFEIIIITQKRKKVNSKKVRQIILKKKINHAQARNLGVAKAKGEIIAFCDDDCVLPPNWLRLGVTSFKDLKVGLVGGPAISPKTDNWRVRFGGLVSVSFFTVGFAAPRHFPLLKKGEVYGLGLVLANNFIRKNVFNEVHGFDRIQVPCEENYLYYKIRAAGYKLLYLPKLKCIHPAKPLFLPWLVKVFFYSQGRGLMLARFFKTVHIQYLIPTLFIFSFLALIVLSLISVKFLIFLKVFLLIYLLANLANAAWLYWKFEKSPWLFLIAPIASILVHFVYGTGVVVGFLKFRFHLIKMGIPMPSKT
jgi:glycosyltransferase involved in cell wall biosynthesis